MIESLVLADIGGGVALSGAGAFVSLVAAYAMVLIRRGDRKELAAYEEMRTERDFWRSYSLTGKPPADAPDHLKALVPTPQEEQP